MNFVKGPIAAGITFTAFDYFASGLRGLATGVHPLHHLDQVDRQLMNNVNLSLVMEYHRAYSENSHAAWGTSPGAERLPESQSSGYWTSHKLVQAQEK